MKDTYVTLKQAQALKRLGFGWECKDYVEKIESSAREEWDEEECVMRTIYDIERYPKPRIDVAAKWLREVKHIDVCAFWDNEDGKWRWCNSDMNSHFREDAIIDRELLYETYEEALSAAITIALKRLEGKI